MLTENPLLNRDGCARQYLDSRGVVPGCGQCLPAMLQTAFARHKANDQHDHE